ncbi:glycosyltransferase family 2 protein [Providencia manganoxydans]|uniref:Glycosyltransferase family 2 protein n=1 Tax=Providencia manganoxydans TaxID=2923283 RepID=A0ABX7AEH6_9GAMM|nr:glycosyltransferase family 2 protein [Providencia manganoxydans]
MNHIKYSLILATLNPKLNLLLRLLDSLSNQSIKNFELIVVDQSTQPVNKDLINNKYSDFFNIYFTTSKKGLSRARNLGARFAKGEFLLFPDDDCWYDCDFFYLLTKYVNNENNKILTFRAANDQNINIAKFDSQPGLCDKFNIWRRVSSISLCVKKDIFEDLSGFDENLGLGSGTLTGACEDIELPLRAMSLNLSVKYNPVIVARHDIPMQRDYNLVIHRAKTHMFSVGYLYKKYNYPLSFILFSISKNIAGILLYTFRFNKKMAKYHYYTALGKINGYLSNDNIKN